MTELLKARYENAVRKFNLADIPVGEMVLIRLNAFSAEQIKKDPSLAELDEPPIYYMGVVGKHLSKAIRVYSAGFHDADGGVDPAFMDYKHNDQAVWLAEATMPIKRLED